MSHPAEQPVVRALVARDVPAVMALYRRAMVPVWDACRRDYDLGRIEANLRHRLGDGEYVVEGVDGPQGLLGYMAWEQHPDHTSRYVIAHLRMLMVDPAHQRSGLATGLVQRFEDAARAAGCTKVLFDVIVGSPANAFYQRLGFRHWSNYMEKVL